MNIMFARMKPSSIHPLVFSPGETKQGMRLKHKPMSPVGFTLPDVEVLGEGDAATQPVNEYLAMTSFRLSLQLT